jgi:hypothetical protein
MTARPPVHAELAAGRWHTFSILDQLGNVASEVGRARAWLDRDRGVAEAAFVRALELIDLTLGDPRWKGARRREIARARELLCSAWLGDPVYRTTLADMESYFMAFALAARSQTLADRERIRSDATGDGPARTA